MGGAEDRLEHNNQIGKKRRFREGRGVGVREGKQVVENARKGQRERSECERLL